MKNQDYYNRKLEVLTHYGDGKLACVLCGFDDVRALSIDHINGGGAKHIRSLHKPFYQWLIEEAYPIGYRTLCMNCQWVTKAQRSQHKLIRQRHPHTVTLEELSQSKLLDWVATSNS